MLNETDIKKSTIVSQLTILIGQLLIGVSITMSNIDIPKPNYWIWITSSLLVVGLSLTMTGLGLVLNAIRSLTSVVCQLQTSELPQERGEYYSSY